MHQPSRRTFLVAAAAATGATYFDLPQLAGAQAASGSFPIGLQSYTLRKFPVEKALEIIRNDLKLHYVELYPEHFRMEPAPGHVTSMLKRLKALDLTWNAHGVNAFGKDADLNRKIFAVARAAGIANLSADPEPESFASLEQLVTEFGIRIAIHNHGPGSRYEKIADVVKAVKGRHPMIGACIDTGHFIRSAEDPVKAARELQGRVFGVHLKDFAEQKANAADIVLGKGHLDVAAFLKALRETKFPADGSLSIEFEGSPDNPVAEVQACVAAVNDAIARIGAG
ncbi:MAG: TIM barrel protein [Planctomycetota bacterium]